MYFSIGFNYGRRRDWHQDFCPLVVKVAARVLGRDISLPMFGNLPDHGERMRKLWRSELMETVEQRGLGNVPWLLLRTAPALVIDAALLRLHFGVVHPENGGSPPVTFFDEAERIRSVDAGRGRAWFKIICMHLRRFFGPRRFTDSCRDQRPFTFVARSAGSVRPYGRTGTGAL